MRLADGFAFLALQDDGETTESVRDRLSSIFERDEFLRSKGWWQRFLEWLASLFDPPELNTPNPSAGGTSGLAQLLAYLVIAALVVGLLVLIVVVVHRRVRRGKVDAPDAEVLVETSEPSSGEWRSMAEQFESAGEWKQAIRCRYRELVGHLVHRRSVPDVPGRTTGELREDMGRSSPAVASSFDEATRLFELPWYADIATGPQENARFRELALLTLAGAREGEPDDTEFLVLAGAGHSDISEAPTDQGLHRSSEGSR